MTKLLMGMVVESGTVLTIGNDTRSVKNTRFEKVIFLQPATEFPASKCGDGATNDVSWRMGNSAH